MLALHKQFPDKHIYFTEGSTFDIPGAVKIISLLRKLVRDSHHNNRPVRIYEDKRLEAIQR